MTLKKDDKTVVKKPKSKAKVWLKPKRVEEDQVKEMPKKDCQAKEEEDSAVEEVEEGERKDWEDDEDSCSGPSGKSFSPEEREKNLQELYRQQRNFLRRVLVDTDDEEEEEEKQEEDYSEEQNTLE